MIHQCSSCCTTFLLLPGSPASPARRTRHAFLLHGKNGKKMRNIGMRRMKSNMIIHQNSSSWVMRSPPFLTFHEVPHRLALAHAGPTRRTDHRILPLPCLPACRPSWDQAFLLQGKSGKKTRNIGMSRTNSSMIIHQNSISWVTCHTSLRLHAQGHLKDPPSFLLRA